MKYLDAGSRDPSQALGRWFEAMVQENEVVEVRWQTGFFTADGLGFLAPTLQRIREHGSTVAALVGSNNGDTLRADVERLLPLLGVPRPGALLGVVSFAGAFFHPKTYHLTRQDGSQAAYVGSANLSSAGVGSLHVEAGILLDTRDGDDQHVVAAIGAAVDSWFGREGRAGLTVIDGPEVIARLVAEGILAEQPQPRAVNEGGGGNAALGKRRPRLQPLVQVPRWGELTAPSVPSRPRDIALAATTAPAHDGRAGSADAGRQTVTRPGFPAYLRFDPTAMSPTTGAAGLSGSTLPDGAAGLIVRLTRDSARHFVGKPGTANISLPVNTVATLRFGLSQKKYRRPRAEFGLRARYIGGGGTFQENDLSTNVMAYGYIEREPGHQNVRMVLPAALRALGAQATAAGLIAPAPGDLAFLEWPTDQAPEFRITFIARESPIQQHALERFDSEAAAGRLVADGAAWLPGGFSPRW